MTKFTLFIFLILSNSCFSQGLPSHFTDYLWGRISCNSIVDPLNHIDYFTKYIGSSYKQEQGAYFFKLNQKGNLFGINVSETFVSDSTIPNFTFVGAIVDDTPDNVAKKLAEAQKGSYFPHNKNEQYKTYYNYSGSSIVWLGATQSKIFCLNKTWPWNFSNKVIK